MEIQVTNAHWIVADSAEPIGAMKKAGCQPLEKLEANELKDYYLKLKGVDQRKGSSPKGNLITMRESLTVRRGSIRRLLRNTHVEITARHELENKVKHCQNSANPDNEVNILIGDWCRYKGKD